MAGYAPQTIKFSIFGTLYTSQTWSTGFACQLGPAAAVPTPQDMIDICNDVWGAAGTQFSAAFSKTNNASCRITGLRADYYGLGGTQASAIGEASDTVASVGNGTANNTPLLALVSTLRTALPGRSGRGRMYWPLTGLATGGTAGQVLTADAGTVATSVAGAFTQINALDASAVWYKGIKVVVASGTKSINNQVTTVDVDTLVDVQHRREDSFTAAGTGTAAVIQ